MTERDDHTDDRRRPAGPAWATVPTMQWSRVPPEQREEDERRREQERRPDGDPAVPVSPAVGEPGGRGPRPGQGGSGGAARGVARPGAPAPDRPAVPPNQVAGRMPDGSAPRLPPPPEAAAAMRFVTRPRSDAPHPEGPRGFDEGYRDSGARGVGYARPADDRPAATGWWGGNDRRDGGAGRGDDRRGDDRRGDDRRGEDRRGDERGRHDGAGRESFGGPVRGTGRASVPTARPAPAEPRPRQPVFVGPDSFPPGLPPDLVEALTAPTPPGGVRYERDRYEPVAAQVSAPPELDAPPVSAPPASAPPVSGPPVSGPPVSAPPGFDAAPTSAPPVSAPPVSAPPTSGPPVSGPPAAADPEQILSGWEWVFDPDTLREVVEDREGLEEIRESLTAKLNAHEDNAPRARLLSLRAVVSRILGDLQKAQADGKLALAHAEATGELRRIAIAQARLAHVLQWRGEFEEADRLFTLANSTELPDRLRATMYQHSGKCAYDQGRYIEACNHFEKALELRKAEDPEMIAHTELALDAVFRRVAENGWGPYPRTREEILQLRRPPTPAMDERTGHWGFTDENGDTKVPAVYSDVQPFRDGVAWVQRPGQQGWELIDESGQTLIPGSAGYLGVSSFSDGLAWVSRDGTARWIGIDKANTVTISTGFEDVRPFRRGMAAVRRGGRWGAVDGIGRQIVAFRYDSFATALSDGRYIDGFSDEGLAVVELGGRKGVVDRAGRVLVEPVYPALVIHPVAFLITDGAHRWGALDRRGRMLITPSHPSRMAVTEEIDRLLVDARPML